MGNVIHIGSMVRIIDIPFAFITQLTREEIKQVSSLIGEVVEVVSIDESGLLWLGKSGNLARGNNIMAVDPAQLEVVPT
ncbi:MAG TPA: hypothetical protein VFF75_03270 [Methylophilaceae bacterium]|nr:hypothetical protein [Methylophilaceae bacterium]